MEITEIAQYVHVTPLGSNSYTNKKMTGSVNRFIIPHF